MRHREGELTSAPEIDYGLLSRVSRDYADLGFKLISVPWCVSIESYRATKPDDSALDIRSPFGCHVASAEQSFIEMMRQGALQDGLYQAITPCFRDDDISEIHFPWFMKLELVQVGVEDPDLAVRLMTSAAIGVLSRYIPFLSVIKTGDLSRDIVSRDGVELGSYGFRELSFDRKKYRLVYGTGLAEPRASMTIKKDVVHAST